MEEVTLAVRRRRPRLAPPGVAEPHGEWDVAGAMLDFVRWLGARDAPDGSGGGLGGFAGGTPSLRDLTAWVEFVNATRPALGGPAAFIHGGSMVAPGELDGKVGTRE